MPENRSLFRAGCFVLAMLAVSGLPAQDNDRQARFEAMSKRAEAEGLEAPFRGIRIGDAMTRGLFPVRSSGVSTEPVVSAAEIFLAALSNDQRERTLHPVDDPEWRKWMNQHFYIRAGVGFDEMDEMQRSAALGLLRASLSAKGLELTRDIMRLNHTLGEMNDNNFDEYGEWLYYITVMGEPSATEPWGWQLDGHHAIINYFVLGDQVVMSPVFVGSEPVTATSGKFAGTEILQAEQRAGLEMLRSLTPAQRAQAVLEMSKDGNNNVGEAFSDNLDLEYQGIAGADLDDAQRQRLLELIGLYVGNLRDGHAAVKMEEVAAHLGETRFAWIGGSADDSVYYYRILSPVVLIEFDHQRPANLRHLYPPVPNRQHIHAVIRTPNGNDYGKDLLRQHYARHAHGGQSPPDSYLDNSGRDDLLSGGVKMVPIDTPDGTYRVWTKRVGNNPSIKLLLLHGGPGMTHEYLEVFDSFLPAAGIEYYYYDQLGSHYSDQPQNPDLWEIPRFVDEVEQVREALGLDRDNFYLYGSSWGGLLAIEYALEYQDRLKGLIVSNMMASIPEYNRYAGNVLMPAMDQEALAEIRRYEAAEDYENPRYAELVMEHHYVDHVLRMPAGEWPEPVTRSLSHLNPDIYIPMQGPSELGASGKLAGWDRMDDLASIDVPTLVIGARHDTMDPAHMKWMAGQFPEGKYLYCPNGSHLPMYDDAETYFDGLIRFLGEVDRGDAGEEIP